MPRIISFAWTTPALLDGAKTCTRRAWSDRYAAQVAAEIRRGAGWWWAYDRNPRAHGHPVARIHPLSLERQCTADMPDGDYAAEGYAWFDDHPDQRSAVLAQLVAGLLLEDARTTTMRQLFDDWREAARLMWVVRFELVEVIGATA